MHLPKGIAYCGGFGNSAIACMFFLLSSILFSDTSGPADSTGGTVGYRESIGSNFRM